MYHLVPYFTKSKKQKNREKIAVFCFRRPEGWKVIPTCPYESSASLFGLLMDSSLGNTSSSWRKELVNFLSEAEADDLAFNSTMFLQQGFNRRYQPWWK